MNVSPRLLSWVSAIGLLAIFGGFAAFEITDRLQSAETLQSVRRSEQVRDAYADAKFEITATGSAGSVYVLGPSPELRLTFDNQLAAARAALDYLAVVGGIKDVQLVDSILEGLLPQVEVVQRFFKSLEAGEPFVETIPDGNVIPQINALLTTAQNKHSADADALFAGYAGWQETRLKVAISAFSLGFLLVMGLIVTSRMFSRREAQSQGELRRWRRVALADSLTELGNRRAFEERVAHLGGASAGIESFAIAMIDVDEFKIVNDTWGHARGDQTLRAIAAELKACLPSGAVAFRIGGDEFAAVFTGIDQGMVVELMEDLRRRVEQSLDAVTVSIGVATVSSAEIDAALLRQQADAALYEAKLRGRNLSILYRFSPESAPMFPAAKLQAVRQLLAEGALKAVFQPIWQLAPRTIVGYEALSRPDESYGLDGPQEAFDIAERFGRSADLDRLCREHTLAAAADLPRDSLLFVNISPYTLTHTSFSASHLRDEFAAAGFVPSQVVLEITERSAVAPEVIGGAARQLRKEGFAIAIDDVGSGNNGIEVLRRVPFDYLKVDRSIVVAAAEGGEGRPAMMAILAFARESGAKVLAEGVETEDCLTLVQDIARGSAHREGEFIQLVQGFLLGMPAEGFAASLLPDLVGDAA